MRQPKAAPSDAAAPASPESWESRAQRGDFGCMVDPAVTMIVQAGSGKGLGLGGPFVDWLGVGEPCLLCSPSLLKVPRLTRISPSPESAGSFLPLPLSPAAHKTLVNLHRIVASALQPSMASFGLQISVILKGARGCGKRTMVRSLAARMGLGVLEVRRASRPAVHRPQQPADASARALAGQLLRGRRRDRRQDGGCPPGAL